jgi:Cu/Ag efflux protein CusF
MVARPTRSTRADSVPTRRSADVAHAAAGRLAYNVRASSVDHTQGKEWLRHDDIAAIDWPAEFHRAVRETLVFLGHDESEAGPPEPVP